MNTTPTPRTDALDNSLQYKAEEMLKSRCKMSDITKLCGTAMFNHARQLEQELNEVKLWIEKSKTAQYVMQVEAERDQLRKVADELVNEVNMHVWVNRPCLDSYDQLPHVIERNK